jgi:ActR/RegA family two-component response regulator
MNQMLRATHLHYERGVEESPAKPLWERRHSFRVLVPGGAGSGTRALPSRASVFHKGKLCGYYAVQDVSIGGCSLSAGPHVAGAPEGAPLRPVGEQVEILLHLPHRAPLALSAQVRRSDSLSMGLKFEHTTPKAEDCIQDFVVETFARAKADDGRIALVVDPRHVERQGLVRTLRELGRRAIGVATALDAVQLLVEENGHVDTVFIEAESASLPSLELVEYLSHNHPRLRRVLVGGQSEIAASWVSQATGEVHALLETPCDQEAVHRILHRLQFTPNDAVLS